MHWKILRIVVFAFFILLPATISSAAGFVTNDTPLWTTTDTNTASSASTSSITMDSVLLDASVNSASQTTSTPGYQSVRYGYDSLDRLKWVEYADGTIINYDYDKVGNRTAKATNITTLPSFTITALVTGSGLIVPSNAVTVVSGGSQTFIFEPAATSPPGSLAALLVDNVQQNTYTLLKDQGEYGSRYYYTFQNVTADHTITATFTTPVPYACSAYPARLVGTSSGNYLSLLAAYNAASAESIIQTTMNHIPDSFLLDRNVGIILDGGYACDFSSKAGSLRIRGKVTIASGSLTLIDTLILGGP